MERTYDVFISYSRKDYTDNHHNVIPGNVVSIIKEAFKKEGITYWFDEEGIYSGQNFTKKIVTNIDASKIFVFISSANSNQSQYTSKEIASAAEFGKYIIPVRIDPTPYSKTVMFRIADLDYIEYYTNPEKGLKDLIDAIKNHLAFLEEEALRKQEEEKRIREEERKRAEEEKIKKEAEERKRQEALQRTFTELKVECQTLNNEETKLYADRNTLLAKAETITDPRLRDELKSFIVNSSPIRQKQQLDFESLQQQIQDLQKNPKKDTTPRKKPMITHLVYGCIILSLVALLFFFNNPKTNSTEDSIADELSRICPTLKANLEGLQNNDPESIYNLGLCAESGNFIEHSNPSLAGELVHHAADMDFAPAQVTLGDYFKFQSKVYPMNYDSMTYWFSRAMDNGSIEGKYRLAVSYADGEYTGTTKSKTLRTAEAVELYSDNACVGHAKSQFRLGEYYFLNKAYLLAKKHYEAALTGDLPSSLKARTQFKLGMLYGEINSTDIEHNDKTAFNWFLKSASNGVEIPDAFYYLGLYYQEGRGTQRDIVKAIEWYSKAAEKDERAKEKLTALSTQLETTN